MLDGHDYLIKRGWKGKGTALNSRGIAKPITVAQKRTLSGLGKDRDEAFPFWEHLYNASLTSIKIKLDNSDTESDAGDSSETSAFVLKRTETGILSNKKPTTGISVPSSSSSSPAPRTNLLANAKRDLARRQLYSRFYQGPVVSNLEIEQPSVITPLSSSEDPVQGASLASEPSASLSTPSTSAASSSRPTPAPTPSTDKASSSKKRKRDTEPATTEALTSEPVPIPDKAARKAARRAKREDKAARRAAREVKRAARAASKAVVGEETTASSSVALAPESMSVNASENAAEDRKRKKKRKEKQQSLIDDVGALAIDPAAGSRKKKRRKE